MRLLRPAQVPASDLDESAENLYPGHQSAKS